MMTEAKQIVDNWCYEHADCNLVALKSSTQVHGSVVVKLLDEMEKLVEAVIVYKQRQGWFSRNILFVSWGKHWKGVYIHFFPWHTVRLYLWGIDWTKKLGNCNGQFN